MHEPLLREIRVLGRLLANLPPVWPCAPLCPSTQRGTCWLDCAVERLAEDGLPFSGCMFRRPASLCLPSPPAYNSRLGSLETLGAAREASGSPVATSVDIVEGVDFLLKVATILRHPLGTRRRFRRALLLMQRRLHLSHPSSSSLTLAPSRPRAEREALARDGRPGVGSRRPIRYHRGARALRS